MSLLNSEKYDLLKVAELPKSIKCIINHHGEEFFYVLPWNEFGHSNWIETWLAFRSNGVKLRLHKSRYYKRMVFRTSTRNKFMREVYKTRQTLDK